MPDPRLEGVTLTGVDMSTDIDAAVELACRHPLVEYGVLLSRSQAGQPGRYGTFAFIEEAGKRFERAGVSAALHVCGGAVHALIAGDAEIEDLTHDYGRIQLNFNAQRTPVDLEALDTCIARLGKQVITQHNDANAAVSAGLRSPNHHVLFDASGGVGKRSDGWPAPIPGKFCGYAGGIGPDTVAADLEGITEATGSGIFWIDMESSLRIDDRFDLDLCRAVMEAVSVQARHRPA